MENPIVTLAGKTYSVPPLVPRQLRQVLPALMRILPVAGDPTKITTAMIDDIMLVLFWGAVWPTEKNNKEASAAMLMDVFIPFQEMTAAMTIIRDQTGLFRNASVEGAQSGEALPQAA